MTITAKKIIPVLILTTFLCFMPLDILIAEAESTGCYRLLYRVEDGDSLQSVSKRFGLEYELVAAMNNLDPGAVLFLGQRIYLPREPENSYVFKAGDTVWDVAKKTGINANSLLAYNGISDPERIQIGEKILLPVENIEEEKAVPALALADSHLSSRGLESFVLPAMGIISSHFGWRRGKFHHGTDIAAETGTPIKAAKAGKVTFAGWRSVYGKTVIIDHGNEMSTLYGHASKILVQKGEGVRRGQVIAKVGSTGNATGPHLHFEVRQKDKCLNPVRFLPGI